MGIIALALAVVVTWVLLGELFWLASSIDPCWRELLRRIARNYLAPRELRKRWTAVLGEGNLPEHSVRRADDTDVRLSKTVHRACLVLGTLNVLLWIWHLTLGMRDVIERAVREIRGR